MRTDLLDVGEQVQVGQGDAFGLAFRARGEEDHRRHLMRRPGGYQPRRHRTDHRRGLVGDRKRLADIFEIDDLGDLLEVLDERVELGKVDESVGGDDAFHLRGPDRRFEARRSRREIEHGRHAAIGRDGEEGDDRAGPGGKHDGDRFAGLGALLQGVAQRQRGPQNIIVGVGALVAVDQRSRGSAETVAGVQQRPEDGLACRVQVERQDGFAWIGGNGC